MHRSSQGREWIREVWDLEDEEKRAGASMIALGVDDIEELGEVGKYRMDKGFEFKMHQHKDWLVAIVISGQVKVQLKGEDEATVYGPGDVYVCEANHPPHRETMLEDTEVVVINGPRVVGEAYATHTVDV